MPCIGTAIQAPQKILSQERRLRDTSPSRTRRINVCFPWNFFFLSKKRPLKFHHNLTSPLIHYLLMLLNSHFCTTLSCVDPFFVFAWSIIYCVTQVVKAAFFPPFSKHSKSIFRFQFCRLVTLFSLYLRVHLSSLVISCEWGTFPVLNYVQFISVMLGNVFFLLVEWQLICAGVKIQWN